MDVQSGESEDEEVTITYWLTYLLRMHFIFDFVLNYPHRQLSRSVRSGLILLV